MVSESLSNTMEGRACWEEIEGNVSDTVWTGSRESQLEPETCISFQGLPLVTDFHKPDPIS